MMQKRRRRNPAAAQKEAAAELALGAAVSSTPKAIEEQKQLTHHTPKNPMLEAALRFRAMGISVIPIERASKKPAIKRWKPYQTRIATESTIRRWFGGRNHNLAVVCGSVSSGLVIVDFDSSAIYDEWKKSHPDYAARLPTIKTARGYHIWFRTEELATHDYRNIGLAIEYRGTSGSYTIAPPSIHPHTGETYVWLIPIADQIPFVDDPWAAGLARHYKPDERKENVIGHREAQNSARTTQERRRDVSGKENASSDPTTDPDFLARAAAALHAVGNACVPAGPGERNAKIFEIIRRMKDYDEFRTLTSIQASRTFRAPFFDWYREIQSKTSQEHSAEESWQGFLFRWPRVHTPYSAVISCAAAMANDLIPSRAIETFAEGRDDPCSILVGGCAALHHISAEEGRDGFFLGCRKAADLLRLATDGALDYQKSQVAYFLRTIAGRGFVQVTRYYPPGWRRASEYRYIEDENVPRMPNTENDLTPETKKPIP